MTKKITIIINDDVNELIRKGEIKNNYYNPKKFFDHIQVILLNNKSIDKKKTFNQLFDCEKLDIIFYKKTIFKIFINFFLFYFFGFETNRDLVNKVKKFNPKILRNYTINFSIFFVYYLHCKTNIKFITSLHCNISSLTKNNKLINRVYWILILPFLKKILSKASFLILKHKGLEKFIKTINKSFETIYTINNKKIIRKKKFNIKKKLKIYNVGRQEKWKNPIILCDKIFKNFNITLIGNGILHNLIKNKIRNKKLKNIRLIKSIDNRILCKQLKNFDIFIHFSEYQEFPNTVMEAMLAGLPVIICKKKSTIVEEYNNKNFILSNDNETSLFNSINNIVSSKKKYNQISLSNYKYAQKNFSPFLMEKKEIDIYKKIFNS